ncbi:hypothetical protein SAMN05444161_3441 [Rhizobiales bacterium GAS191]|jgi:hypothetical protein|nr:hypothetical protein SAMN05519103_02559 [Rhizobiales bacterium GAS113]SEB73708.1 hypothetical protein SAMN05519104_0007 [Rhizobiales bacterium GAS188]SED54609.1 hypothetical protein SAMN05444161_3441 [Rhizobiales bacterium GAS191]
MQQAIESRRPSRIRQVPEAAIPKFRELRLSAVVAACAWPRTQTARRDESTDATPPATRFEEG